MVQSLKEQLKAILASSDFLSADPEKRVSGSDLLAKVKPLIKGSFSDHSIRVYFSVLSQDPTSPIASSEGGSGYYRRDLAASEAPIEKPAVRLPGSANQPEEKFRAVYIRHQEAVQRGRFLLRMNQTSGAKTIGGMNKWKFPDVVVLDWQVLADDGAEKAKSKGKPLNETMLRLRGGLGAPPFRLTSVELKVALTPSNFRENFFQCVSNSKWAHEAQLIIATPLDEALSRELRRLGASYDVTVINYQFSRAAIDKLPSASRITEMSDDDIDRIVSGSLPRILQKAPDRSELDWAHLDDMRNQSTQFGELLEWVARCLKERRAYSFDDFRSLVGILGK